MNKKIFEIKLSTIITMIACVAVALLIWMIVNYKTGGADSLETAYFCHEVIKR